MKLKPGWLQNGRRYLSALDATVLTALAVLVLFTASRHEPWADEAQAWLLARDFRWWHLVLHELRYEGHPPLWFSILWPAIHYFHLPYAYFSYLSGSIAILGLAVLIFLAPFPRILRYAIAGSFFFIYQYAVIARPYVLMPLLGFGAAYSYRKGLPRILAFGVCTALLIQVSSYAAVVAFSLAVFYALQIGSRWREIAQCDRKRAIAAGALILFSIVVVVAVLLPPSDASLMAEARHTPLQRHLESVAEALVGAFSNSAFMTFPVLFIAGIWAHERRGLLLLLLSVGGTALVYGFLRGFGHHQCLITIAFVVTLWALWPKSEELSAASQNLSSGYQAFSVLLLLLFGWQCVWSYSTIRKDWAGAYSGALDAATFLKLVHAEKVGCRGYGYWAVGVQPYFDHNLFANFGGPGAAASAHFSFDAGKRGSIIYDWEIQTGPPLLVLAVETAPQESLATVQSFANANYRLIHYSDGTRFFKNNDGVHALYLIFAREDWLREEAAAGRPIATGPTGE